MRLVLDKVSYCFGTQYPLFSDICYTVKPGKTVALTGPSGSGKSTLLSLIAGWEPCRSGSISFDAGDPDLIRAGREKPTPKISWVFQNPHGVAYRNVLDHVVLPLISRGMNRKTAEGQARSLLGNFGLESSREKIFAALSGGEAQRLMLARAMATAFDVLLIDEPTAQLDRHSAERVNQALFRLVSDKIVIIATHDPRTVEACGEVLNLEDYQ